MSAQECRLQASGRLQEPIKRHRQGVTDPPGVNPPIRGDRNECPTCGELFNSTHAFDKHRVGPYGEFGRHRRCLTNDEMAVRGMTRNAAGFWITQKRVMEITS